MYRTAEFGGLSGKLFLDGDDYFEFKCNDDVMAMRGGTYKFMALEIEVFRKEIYKWISMGKEIAEACHATNDLYYWYRKNWPNSRLTEIWQYEMEENARLGIRTDYWNMEE